MDLIDEEYLKQNQEAMSYVKLSAGSIAFHSSYLPLAHGETAFEELLRALQDAEDEIFLSTWFLECDMEISRRDWDQAVVDRQKYVLEQVLLDRARAGVVVRILVWNFLNLGLAANLASAASGGNQGGGKPNPLNPPMKRVKKLEKELSAISPRNEVIVVEHPMPFAPRVLFGASFLLGGSHHQKVWILRSGNRHLAYVGGINLRQHDWDTGFHEVLDQRRNAASMEGTERKRKETAGEDPDYPPRHDWMTRIEGPAAFRVLEEFDKRWRMAGKSQLTLVPFAQVQAGGKLFVQKSHTWPIQYGGGSREILEVYKHALSRARLYAYFENQYWTTEELTTVLEERLAQEKGLQVVIVLPDKAEDPGVGPYIAGEQWYQLSRLWKVGGASRVRAYVMYKKHPAKRAYVNVYVHAKIAIVDDLWATIGSANTNNRSMLIDTECNAQIAHGPTVKAMRKAAWQEMLGSEKGEDEDPQKAIQHGWEPTGEINKALMEEGKELEGLIVPLKEPAGGIKRLPEGVRGLL